MQNAGILLTVNYKIVKFLKFFKYYKNINMKKKNRQDGERLGSWDVYPEVNVLGFLDHIKLSCLAGNYHIYL